MAGFIWANADGVGCGRKLRPTLPMQNGMHFPFERQAESTSQFEASEWDVLSPGVSSGNCIPEFRLKTGRIFL